MTIVGCAPQGGGGRETAGVLDRLWSARFGLAVVLTIALGLTIARPAQAGETGTTEAEKLRRLDIMLMVTSLRCRTTADNFMDDYGRFTRNHLSELNEANRELRTELAARQGPANAARQLDRLSVVMANQYGGGHPWLNCSQLRQATRDLAEVQGHDTLVEAAGQLLDAQPRPVMALAGR